MYRLFGLLVALSLAVGTATAQAQERRVALLIGNGSYKFAPGQPNGPNDARAMETALREVNFETTLVLDAEAPEMKAAIDDFSKRLARGADTALFFYSGRAVGSGNFTPAPADWIGKQLTYLQPVDAHINTRRAIEADCIEIQAVFAAMNVLNIPVKLVINNSPVFTNESRIPAGFFFASALAPGELSLDSAERETSPFATALIKALKVPGLRIDETLALAGQIESESSPNAIPWTAYSLRQSFYFRSSTKVR